METDYDSFEALEQDYDRERIVPGKGETAQEAMEDAYNELPTNATGIGAYTAEAADEFFSFLGYELEEQRGGGAAAEDIVEDTLDPR